MKRQRPTQARLLAFVHIEKTAGRTLCSILQHNYGAGYSYVRTVFAKSNRVFSARDLKVYRLLNPFLRCIAGHCVVPYSDLENMVPNIHYITLLRNPIDRYISYYTYGGGVQRKPWPFDFEEYLAKEHFRNYQTKKIAGCDDVEKAKRILTKKFLVVGIQEDFDVFLVMLGSSSRIRGFDIRYTRKNVRIDAQRGQLIKRYEEAIYDNNLSDLELYDYVKRRLLPLQRERYEGDLAEEVARFKSRNSCYGAEPTLSKSLGNRYNKYVVHPAIGLMRVSQGLLPNGIY